VGEAARVLTEVEIDELEADRGTTREVRFAAGDECELCAGTGAAPGSSVRECTTCGGKGTLRISSGIGFGRCLQVERCRDCAGLGRIVARPCPECRGSGRVAHRRALWVRIPAGVADGTHLRVIAEPEDEHLLVRVLPRPIDSALTRWAATALLLVAIALLAYVVWFS
jgi:molecular chaperone DnaJ